jgi:uncharacterized protein YndB with AHSA1/START domain
MSQREEVVEVETRIDAPPEVVFEYFTDPAKHARWMGSSAKLDPRPDGELAVTVPGDHTAWGRYLVVDPPKRLSFTFGWDDSPDVPPGSSTVEVTFVPDGDGTIVRLRHSGLPNDQQREMHGHGWTLYLGRLSVAAAGGDPGPDASSA